VRRILKAALVPIMIFALCAGAGLVYVRVWYDRPLAGVREPVTVEIAPGEGASAVAARLAKAGILDQPKLWVFFARYQGDESRLRAGEYLIEPGTTPEGLLEQLVEGRVLLHPITIVEGWTAAEAVRALAQSPFLRRVLPDPDSPGADRAWLVAAGGPDAPAEGQFFPDTYLVPRGTTDADVLKLAHARMAQELSAAWAARAPDLPLAGPYDALILASVIEKETAAADERPMIAAVFVNRLRRGMRLQTDPTLIYGLGSRYDGSLHHRDVTTDTPYNTYTRAGLPPTPIALPGRESLRAAVAPADSGALYFVATGKGDGRHVFSTTLAAHEAAVARYVARARAAGRPTSR
jgi:UPF0755 protein